VSHRDADSLLRDLVRDLAPVRPIRRLRTIAAIAFALAVPGWLFALALTGGIRSDLGSLLSGDVAFVSIAVGLMSFGVAAVVAAAALAVPGREAAARVALAFAAVGAGIAFGFGPVCTAVLHGAELHPPGSVDLGCLLKGLVAGSLTSFATARFVARAAPRHGAVTLALAFAAGGALGGLAMHAGCSAPDAWHWLFGHAGAAWVAGLAAIPLAALAGIRRDRRLRA
jgi:hypothetical protein